MMRFLAAVLAMCGAGIFGGLTMFVLTIVWARDTSAQLNSNELAAIPWVFLGWTIVAAFGYGTWLGLGEPGS